MASIEKPNSGRWQAGKSSNPKGCNRGSGKVLQFVTKPSQKESNPKFIRLTIT